MRKLRRSAPVLVASLGMISCQPASTSFAFDVPGKIDFLEGFQQSDADAIVRECGADDVKLVVIQSGDVTFEPDPNSDYNASVCVLEYIKKSGTTKFGFVGNEKFVAPEEGQ